MNKMLVAVFENETAADEGLRALKDLHQEGELTLFATAVISKNEKGYLEVKSAADSGEVGAATGLLAGSLIGLIGRPAGMALSAASGLFAGLVFGIGSDDINIKFIDSVSRTLTKGKTAIIAEIDESWTIPLDTRLANAMVFRRMRNEVLESQLLREGEAIEAEARKLRKELIKADEESKSEIHSAIGKLEEKARSAHDQVKRKLDETRRELEAKINAFKEQRHGVKKKKRKKMKNRIEEFETEYGVRAIKLKQAAKLVSEALGRREKIEKVKKNEKLRALA